MTLRVGVVGGGLVAQAMHLHYLAAGRDRFRLVGLAEPSRTVREALGATGLEVQTTRVATLPLIALAAGETTTAEVSRVALDTARTAVDSCIQEEIGYVALGAIEVLLPELQSDLADHDL